jgi:hypothetical protein
MKKIYGTILGLLHPLDFNITQFMYREGRERITIKPHARQHFARAKNPTWERTRLLLSSKSKLLLPCKASASTICSTSPDTMEFSSKSASAAIVCGEVRRWNVPLDKASQSLLPLLRLVSEADRPEFCPTDVLLRTETGPALD